MTTHFGDDFLEASLLERYCSGTASAEENARIDVWFGEHPGRRVWYERLRAGLLADGFSAMSAEERRAAWLETVEGALERSPDKRGKLLEVVATVGNADHVGRYISPDHAGRGANTESRFLGLRRHSHGDFSKQPLRRNSFNKPPQRRRVWSAVVVAACMTAVTIMAWSAGVSHVRQREAKVMSTYSTANGQRASYTLPDGGTVSLNVGSRLDVPGDYADGHRTVRLVGEAMFSVAQVAGAPFTVLAGNDTVRVLGTTFLVQHYPSDSLTTVAVREGKVAVHAMVVTAAQQVAIGRHGAGPVQAVDPAQFSFATGVLVLNGVSLLDGIATLNRWYDTDIRLGDQTLTKRHIAGEFAAGTVANLVEYLSGPFGVRVVRNGRVLTLFSR